MTAEAIIAVIDALCEKMGVAIDWSAENVLPEIEALIGQLATAKATLHGNIFWISVVMMGIAIVMFFVSVKMHRTLTDNCKHSSWDGIAGVIALLMLVLLPIIIISRVQYIEWSQMPTIKAYKWITSEIGGK